MILGGDVTRMFGWERGRVAGGSDAEEELLLARTRNAGSWQPRAAQLLDWGGPKGWGPALPTCKRSLGVSPVANL
jgi:hypothetical protein